jgi:hypothetical protein
MTVAPAGTVTAALRPTPTIRSPSNDDGLIGHDAFAIHRNDVDVDDRGDKVSAGWRDSRFLHRNRGGQQQPDQRIREACH